MITAFPTNNYPAIYYSTSRSVEAGLPVTAAIPTYEELVTDNIAASGKRESIVLRREERRQLTFFGLDAAELDLWRQYFQDHGARGKQAELLVDRFTGRVFTFPNTVTDQNLNAASLQLATVFTVFSGKAALNLPGSGTFLLDNWPGSYSGALVTSGGVIVLTLAPNFVSTDASTAHFLDMVAAGGGERIRLYKSGVNQIDFDVAGTGGTRSIVRYSAASWSIGDAISIIARYNGTTVSSPALWFNTVQATNYVQTGATLSTLPSTICFHHDNANANFADTKVLLLGFFKYAYDDPTVLTSHFPMGRNYYGTAELLERLFTPQRIAPTVDLWQFTWNFRVGF